MVAKALLCSCRGVLSGCYRVGVQLLRCFRLLPKHCCVVAELVWVVSKALLYSCEGILCGC